MAWDDFLTMRQSMQDIDAAVAASSIAVLDRAPTDYFDLRDYLPAATVGAVELYGQAARDVAMDYLSVTAPVIVGSLVAERPSKAAMAAAATRVALWALTETGPGQIVTTEVLLPKLYAGTSRLVRSQGRGMLARLAADERTPISARRIPQPGACNFCRMVSLNHYATAEAAGSVVGRRSGYLARDTHTAQQRAIYLRKYGPAGRTLRSGGSQPLGEKYHDHCQCEVHITYAGEPDDIPHETAVMLDQYADDYYDGVRGAKAKYGVTHPSTPQVLSVMREITRGK